MTRSVHGLLLMNSDMCGCGTLKQVDVPAIRPANWLGYEWVRRIVSEITHGLGRRPQSATSSVLAQIVAYGANFRHHESAGGYVSGLSSATIDHRPTKLRKAPFDMNSRFWRKLSSRRYSRVL